MTKNGTDSEIVSEEELAKNDSEPASVQNLFNDPFRSSLASAIGLLLTSAYLGQRSRMMELMNLSKQASSNTNEEIKSAMENEPQKIAQVIEQAYADAISMGYNHGLMQSGSDQKIDAELVKQFATAEALRCGAKLSNQTQNDFDFVLKKFASSDINEIIQRVYTPKRTQDALISEVNRLFNLGIQLAGKQLQIKKMKWIAECPVCAHRNNKVTNIASDVIPGLHKTCTCTIELLKEE
jgi:hypothetical protein